MNSLFIIILALPALEIFVMIKIGQQVGALNTIFLIILTAILGVYFAKLQGLKAIKSGFLNIYQNKTPVYEIVTGASIALAAALLIIPGFITDTFGLILLIPITRKILLKTFYKTSNVESHYKDDVLDGEVVDENDKKDEL
jgi:UPF0716 protein FxsA